jgi:TetR/AcrR family transcriptional regulator
MTDEIHRVRDPEATRAAVLTAAERLFAEQGFANTSMRDISCASGVSHPLIHHHFGSKEELYAAVKRRLVEGYARTFPQAAKATNRPINLGAEMRRIMAYIGANPMLLRLCQRTRLDGDSQVWPGEPDMFDTLKRRIEVSQRRKLIRDDLDSTYLSITILGLVMLWLENREFFKQRFGPQLNDQDYLQQAIDILQRGLGLDPEQADSENDEAEIAELNEVIEADPADGVR